MYDESFSRENTYRRLLNQNDDPIHQDYYKMMKNDYRQAKAEVKILETLLNYIDEKDENDDEAFQE